MESTTHELPNQVEPTKVYNIKTTENKKSDVIKEIWEYSHKNVSEEIKELKDLNKKMIEKMELICKQKDGTEDSMFVRVIIWVAISLFTCSAAYWNYETLVAYRSEPLMSTTNIIQNKTFTWPTITVEPSHKCYNNTALDEVRKVYKVGYTHDRPDIVPFNITDKNFNWAHNVSKMYLQTKYRPPVAHFISQCLYSNAATNKADCYNEKKGNWETYATQYGTKESFTPAPAISFRDHIDIMVNSYNCEYFIVSIHPSTDRYYMTHPSAHPFYIYPGENTDVRLAVEEFHQISTRPRPCVEDMHYSQAQCYETKIIQYKIKNAGCHFPAITGYQHHGGNFPECNNYSSYQSFMYWHKELYFREYKYEDLQKMKAECGEPCHTMRYYSTEMMKWYNGRKPRFLSYITLRLSTRAMSYLSINEKRAMTIDELIANIGGTLGLFLGISFLTAISSLKFFIRRIIKLYRKD